MCKKGATTNFFILIVTSIILLHHAESLHGQTPSPRLARRADNFNYETCIKDPDGWCFCSEDKQDCMCEGGWVRYGIPGPGDGPPIGGPWWKGRLSNESVLCDKHNFEKDSALAVTDKGKVCHCCKRADGCPVIAAHWTPPLSTPIPPKPSPSTPAPPGSTQGPKATIFSSMDKDNSGDISLGELRSFMRQEDRTVTELQVQDRFKQMDVNPADGIVSKQEYLSFIPTSPPTATPASPSSTQDPKATIFSSIDTDNSGDISLAEVRSFMENTDGAVTEQQVQDHFAQMDVNQDGIVSKEEYLSRAVNATNVLPFANVSFNEGFQTFDKDGTGKLNRKEFEKAMASLGMRLSPGEFELLWRQADADGSGEIELQEWFDADGSGKLERQEFEKVMVSLGMQLTPGEFDALWREADMDGSGDISLQEFALVVKNRGVNLTNKRNVMQIEQARAFAQQASVAVGAMIGASVAVSIAASVCFYGCVGLVAASMESDRHSDGGGAFGSLSPGGISGPGALTIIGHVQVLSQIGKVGGKPGGDNESSLAEFSRGFGWANAELPFSLFSIGNIPEPAGKEREKRRTFRRSTKLPIPGVGESYEEMLDPKCQSKESLPNEQSKNCQRCGLVNGVPLLERLIIVLGSIAACFVLRGFLQYLWTIHFKKEPLMALMFPVWEGTLLLFHWFGMCESLAHTLGRPCAAWFGLAAAFILLGPLGFLVYTLYAIRQHVNTGDLIFDISENITWKDAQEKMRKETKIMRKLIIINEWYMSKGHRGSWRVNPKCRLFSFLIRDYASWNFFAWWLLRRTILAVVMALTFEVTNACLVILLEISNLTLLFSLPSAYHVVNALEIFGSGTNLVSMTFASLPAFFGDMPEFVGDLMLMCIALAGTAVVAVFILISSLIGLVGVILVLFTPAKDSTAKSCSPGIDSVVVAAGDTSLGASAEARLEAMGGDAEELEKTLMSEGNHGFLIGAAVGASMASSVLDGVANEKKPAYIILKLLLDFDEAGEEGSSERAEFEDDLIQDLALASGMPPKCFEVDHLERGGIIVHILIYPNESDKSPDEDIIPPLLAVDNLKLQLSREFSLLRHGTITQYLESLQARDVPIAKVAKAHQNNPVNDNHDLEDEHTGQHQPKETTQEINMPSKPCTPVPVVAAAKATQPPPSEQVSAQHKPKERAQEVNMPSKPCAPLPEVIVAHATRPPPSEPLLSVTTPRTPSPIAEREQPKSHDQLQQQKPHEHGKVSGADVQQQQMRPPPSEPLFSVTTPRTPSPIAEREQPKSHDQLQQQKNHEHRPNLGADVQQQQKPTAPDSSLQSIKRRASPKNKVHWVDAYNLKYEEKLKELEQNAAKNFNQLEQDSAQDLKKMEERAAHLEQVRHVISSTCSSPNSFDVRYLKSNSSVEDKIVDSAFDIGTPVPEFSEASDTKSPDRAAETLKRLAQEGSLGQGVDFEQQDRDSLQGSDFSGFCHLSEATLNNFDLSEAKSEGENLRSTSGVGSVETIFDGVPVLQDAKGGRATTVAVTSPLGLQYDLIRGKPLEISLPEACGLNLHHVTLANKYDDHNCAKDIELLTAPSKAGPWTSLFTFVAQKSKQKQIFQAPYNAPALSGFVQILVRYTYGGSANVLSMELTVERRGPA